MSRYLRHLAERSLGVADVARAVVPALYADWRRAGPAWAPDTLDSYGREGLEVEPEELPPPHEPRRASRRPRSAEPTPNDSEEAGIRPAGARRTDSRPEAPREAVPAADVPELPPVPTTATRETRRIAPVVTRTPPPGRAEPRSPRSLPAPAEPVVRSADVGPRRVVASVTEQAAVTVPPILPSRPSLPALESVRHMEARQTTLAPAGAPDAPIPRVVVPRTAAAPATRTAGSLRGSDPTGMPAEDRIVEISIGRIEVRATPAPVREHPTPALRPTLSLDAYLHGRAREGRR
jgi:hypothetical protein